MTCACSNDPSPSPPSLLISSLFANSHLITSHTSFYEDTTVGLHGTRLRRLKISSSGPLITSKASSTANQHLLYFLTPFPSVPIQRQSHEAQFPLTLVVREVVWAQTSVSLSQPSSASGESGESGGTRWEPSAAAAASEPNSSLSSIPPCPSLPPPPVASAFSFFLPFCLGKIGSQWRDNRNLGARAYPFAG